MDFLSINIEEFLIFLCFVCIHPRYNLIFVCFTWYAAVMRLQMPFSNSTIFIDLFH